MASFSIATLIGVTPDTRAESIRVASSVSVIPSTTRFGSSEVVGSLVITPVAKVEIPTVEKQNETARALAAIPRVSVATDRQSAAREAGILELSRLGFPMFVADVSEDLRNVQGWVMTGRPVGLR